MLTVSRTGHQGSLGPCGIVIEAHDGLHLDIRSRCDADGRLVFAIHDALLNRATGVLPENVQVRHECPRLPRSTGTTNLREPARIIGPVNNLRPETPPPPYSSRGPSSYTSIEVGLCRCAGCVRNCFPLAAGSDGLDNSSNGQDNTESSARQDVRLLRSYLEMFPVPPRQDIRPGTIPPLPLPPFWPPLSELQAPSDTLTPTSSRSASPKSSAAFVIPSTVVSESFIHADDVLPSRFVIPIGVIAEFWIQGDDVLAPFAVDDEGEANLGALAPVIAPRDPATT